MSARTWMLARLTGALVPQERAEQELDAYRDEVRTQDAAEIAALRAQVAELLVERHSTNESLSETAEALRVQRDRIAELETLLGNLSEPDVDGTGRTYAEYYPTARPHPTHRDSGDYPQGTAVRVQMTRPRKDMTTRTTPGSAQ